MGNPNTKSHLSSNTMTRHQKKLKDFAAALMETCTATAARSVWASSRNIRMTGWEVSCFKQRPNLVKQYFETVQITSFDH